jgi:transcription initiation factor TFIIIB Brf1 subunit/transcription initiation factor TFIIB
MSTARWFVSALQQEQRRGNVSAETEQHLKHEFRRLGRDASNTVLAKAVEAEIKRLERQAATLRQLRGALLDMA